MCRVLSSSACWDVTVDLSIFLMVHETSTQYVTSHHAFYTHMHTKQFHKWGKVPKIPLFVVEYVLISLKALNRFVLTQTVTMENILETKEPVLRIELLISQISFGLL